MPNPALAITVLATRDRPSDRYPVATKRSDLNPGPARADAPRWLRALGLHRPELRAWAMYDWGISGMQTIIMTAVFPIFFVKVAAAAFEAERASAWWGYVNTIGAILIAISAPVLGALADFKAAKKKFLVAFMLLGAGATAAMFFIQRGDMVFASVTFILSLAGATGSMTFYESLLPHIADETEVDRVSTAGYALGYIGGGILLALALFVIQKPALFGLPHGDALSSADSTLPVRLSFLAVAAWWLAFAIPVLRVVAEPPRALEPDEATIAAPIRASIKRLATTLRELRDYKQAFLMMLAFTIYNDGIQTIIKMASVYGTELKIDQGQLIAAILLVQFIGVPAAFAFGGIAGKLGAKRAIFLGLLVYTAICIFGYFLRTARDFWILAIAVGLVQGGTQALSRSLFSTLVPKHKSGEFFGFFSVFEKFGGILGPLAFAVAAQLAGNSRVAILSVILFFFVGALLLLRVDEQAGAAAARAADEGTITPVSSAH
jgi:MFS transporter, UMF1 family